MSLLFDIKRYAINDGPGIRIALYYKGCPLKCVWCHNPEGISPSQQKMYSRNRCIGCSSCIERCPEGALKLISKGIQTDFTRCTQCGICTEVCPTQAMELLGKGYTIQELVSEIEKERPFIESSGGGVTFGGGEPLMHLSDLMPLLEQCGAVGLHRTVDTTLYVSPESLKRVAQACELFLIDLKQMNNDLHRLMCGVSNSLILDNLRLISTLQKEYYIRIPLIDGFNSDDDKIEEVIHFLQSVDRKPTVINLLPYHDVARGKHEKLGSTYNPRGYLLSAPSLGRQQQIVNHFLAAGFNAKIGG
ncbi:MAG: glycyl-radical enzyme activating protein [Phocaeicola sp.]